MSPGAKGNRDQLESLEIHTKQLELGLANIDKNKHPKWKGTTLNEHVGHYEENNEKIIRGCKVMCASVDGSTVKCSKVVRMCSLKGVGGVVGERCQWNGGKSISSFSPGGQVACKVLIQKVSRWRRCRRRSPPRG